MVASLNIWVLSNKLSLTENPYALLCHPITQMLFAFMSNIYLITFIIASPVRGHFCTALVFDTASVLLTPTNLHIHCSHNSSCIVWKQICWEERVSKVEATPNGSILDPEQSVSKYPWLHIVVAATLWASCQCCGSLLFMKQDDTNSGKK